MGHDPSNTAPRSGDVPHGSNSACQAKMKKKLPRAFPTARLILARAYIRTGFRYKDRGLLRTGQALYLKELATIHMQTSEGDQLELPLDDGKSRNLPSQNT